MRMFPWYEPQRLVTAHVPKIQARLQGKIWERTSNICCPVYQHVSDSPYAAHGEKCVLFIVHMCLSGFADIVKARHSQSWITNKKQCLSYSFDKTRRLHVPLMPCFFLSFFLCSFIKMILFWRKRKERVFLTSFALSTMDSWSHYFVNYQFYLVALHSSRTCNIHGTFPFHKRFIYSRKSFFGLKCSLY